MTHAETVAKELGGELKEGTKKKRKADVSTEADRAARAMGHSKEEKK